MKKLIIFFITLVLFSLLLADGTPPDGEGTETDPYQIATLDNLLWLTTTATVWTSTTYFLQTEDIDASDTQNWNDGAGFIPIGEFSTPFFQSTYIGDDHVIDSLYINRPNTDYVGVFGYVYGATIEALSVTNITISGRNDVGGIVGNCYYAAISECYVNGDISGGDEVGVLVGWSYYSTITGSYAEGSVTGNQKIGFLVGINTKTTINNSYYNYETALINDQHLFSIGALTNDLYNDWMNNNMILDISDYLTFDGDYYLISNEDDLEKLLFFGQYPEYNYLLTADLDLATYPDFFIPYLAGDFNGSYHIIDGLDVNCPAISTIGLFGYVTGVSISALGITNANVSGSNYTGSVAGWFYNSTLNECYASGNVTGSYFVGGFVARNDFSTISECYATSSVTGSDFVGSLVGVNIGDGLIINCYARGDATGEFEVGGLVGNNHQSTISKCYATGVVDGRTNHGGLLGYNYHADINYCVWNAETSGENYSVGENFYGIVLGLVSANTAEMQMMSTFTDIGWDFANESINGDEDFWNIAAETNDGFPYIDDIELNVINDENVIENVKLKIENYPNPFNPVTNICFEIAKSNDVQVNIYNLRGQKVKTLVDGYLEAGKHFIIWDAENQSSGIYFIYFDSGTLSDVKKITLLK